MCKYVGGGQYRRDGWRKQNSGVYQRNPPTPSRGTDHVKTKGRLKAHDVRGPRSPVDSMKQIVEAVIGLISNMQASAAALQSTSETITGGKMSGRSASRANKTAIEGPHEDGI